MPTIVEKPKIAEEILQQLEVKVQEERQVIVHCMLPASPFPGNLVRIWKSTVLHDQQTDYLSELVHAENISYFPFWTEVPPGKDFWFTLVFTGLPKDCKMFDLVEFIPHPGGFHVRNIQRNSSDVYRVKISEG